MSNLFWLNDRSVNPPWEHIEWDLCAIVFPSLVLATYITTGLLMLYKGVPGVQYWHHRTNMVQKIKSLSSGKASEDWLVMWSGRIGGLVLLFLQAPLGHHLISSGGMSVPSIHLGYISSGMGVPLLFQVGYWRTLTTTEPLGHRNGVSAPRCPGPKANPMKSAMIFRP